MSWSCPRCTFENPAENELCATCEEGLRPAEREERKHERIDFAPAPAILPKNSTPSPVSTATGIQAVTKLCQAIAKKRNVDHLRSMVERDRIDITGYNRQGLTPLIVAIWADRADVIDFLISKGANVNQSSAPPTSKHPLLYSILNTTDEMTRYILARGADVSLCREQLLEALPELPISIRYWINRAFTLPTLSPTALERLQKMKLARLREMMWSVVGQRIATLMFERSVASYRVDAPKAPLVLLFAGPPGHGKTVLAERAGAAIVGSDNYLKIDCPASQTYFEMFGATAPYEGWEGGSKINNFISKHGSTPSVVLLDEIEKTNRDVLEGFLNPWDKGEWEDKRVREGKTIKIPNTIFILTTNKLDPHIISYFERNSHKLNAEDPAEFDDLQVMLRERLSGMYPFSQAIVRRIHFIVPFIPFTKTESQVICDQLMRNVCIRVSEPADESQRKHLGHVKLHFTDECVRALAKSYTPAEGAASLQRRIEEVVKQPIADQFVYDKLGQYDAEEEKKRPPRPTCDPKNPDIKYRKFHSLAGIHRENESACTSAVWVDYEDRIRHYTCEPQPTRRRPVTPEPNQQSKYSEEDEKKAVEPQAPSSDDHADEDVDDSGDEKELVFG